MPNRFNSDIGKALMPNVMPPKPRKGKEAGFKEKPAFPSASLPGKSGPDRSSGTKRLRTAKTIGL